MTNKDPFEKIHTLLSKSQIDAALEHLYDSQNDVIRQPFTSDENHAWYIVGDIFYRTKNYHRAILAFKRSLKGWPEDLEAYWALGESYSCLGEHQAAERCFRIALQISPKSQEVKFNLANSLFDQEKYDDAIELYQSIGRGKSDIAIKAKKNLALAKAKSKK